MRRVRRLEEGEWVCTPFGAGRIEAISTLHIPTSDDLYEKPILVRFADRTERFKHIEVFRISFLAFLFDGPDKRLGFGLSPLRHVAVTHLASLAMMVFIIMADIELPWKFVGATLAISASLVWWIKAHRDFYGR